MSNSTKQARRQVFNRQIARLDEKLIEMQGFDRRFFWMRLGVLLAGGLLIFLAFTTGQVRLILGAAALFVLAFMIVVIFHRRLDRSILRFKLSRRLAAVQAARMELDWSQIPLPPASPSASSHPFAADLNLVGERSLHQLIDTAMSLGGSQRLLSWLLQPAPDFEQIRKRHVFLREIEPLNALRRRLALSGALVASDPHERWNGEQLLRWLQGEPQARPLGRVLIALGLLAALNIALFLLSTFAALPPLWIFSFVLYLMIYYSRYREVGELFGDARQIGDTLEKFRAVLVYLEQYPYPPGSLLERLCEPFWQADKKPSRFLRRLIWIASAASLQGNPFVWMVLNALLPWDLYIAYRLSGTKEEMKSLLPAWLDAWYELEALNSLANFAYLNPGYSIPDVIESSSAATPVFAGLQLGHPLIPDAVKVCNDFAIQELGDIALITGSNMSGKSTFLRTLGINLILAFTGGPVNAASLQTELFRVFTSINVSDSLSDGISYFYAEVRRLKSLLNELEKIDQPPVFFLIDEIFRGTNNRERQIGSRSYVEALAGSRGTGVISTHDLELVHLADELPAIHNYHFREEVRDQRMVFDYRLRPGPSPTTNALKIMQLEGLPINSISDL